MAEDRRDPRAEYQRRLSARQAMAKSLAHRDEVFANTRMVLFAIALFMGAGAVAGVGFHWGWIAAPLVIFVGIALVHERTVRQMERANGAVVFYERALARMDGRWAGVGVQGTELVPSDHLYANDLDLFGEGSLFELLCTARTRSGEEVLAKWMCRGESREGALARQEAVLELRDRVDLREELALLGGDMRARVKPADLVAWAEAPPIFSAGPARALSYVLTVSAVGSMFAWGFFGSGPFPLLLVALVELGYMRAMRARILAVSAAIQGPEKDLDVLGHVLHRLEEEAVSSAALASLQERIRDSGITASNRIHRLRSLLQWMEAQRNPMFAPLAFLILWPVHFSYGLEKWRTTHGHRVEAWLDAVGEFEAVCSLATFAYEHPEYPFAELVDDAAVYEGVEVGHPLIGESDRVVNDVSLDSRPQALLVSGSNMSGKSTLLRTVGINAVLALAGAPVCAKSLRISPLSIGATLSIHDSIQEGASRFYAEITRLSHLLDLTKGDWPVLFLVDEILAGTNSHDRGIGAQAIVKSLLKSGAIGLVTTHDLAITKLVDEVGDLLTNIHFEDTLEGDRLVFDYKVRPGVVQKSNALALMRAVGLEV